MWLSENPAFQQGSPPGGAPKGFELVVSGSLSEQIRQQARGMGIDVTEGANVLLGLID